MPERGWHSEGLAQVHVPFSLQDLAQIEAKLGSFSSNPTQYIKQFTGLTRAYALTWQDIYVILGSTTIPEERQAIWTAAKAQADQRHYANPSPERPPGLRRFLTLTLIGTTRRGVAASCKYAI